MAEDNQYNIKQLISKAMSQQSPSVSIKIIKEIYSIIIDYLYRLDNFYLKLEQAAQLIPEYQALDADDTTIKYDLYKKISSNESQIENLLKEGYKLIQEIREAFTGEIIKYVIGTVYRKNLYETEMTLSQILDKASLSFNSNAKIDNLYKLRLNFKNKGQLKKAAGEAIAKVDKNTQKASTVFSAVWRYFHSQQNNHGKKINKGNMYETYKVAIALRKPPNANIIPPPITDEEIFKIFNDVKRNTISFRQGGDLLTEQYKFFSSLPSLMTTATARNDLSQLAGIFQKFIFSQNTGQFSASLQQFFIKDPSLDTAAGEIEREGINQAKDYLDNLFKNMKLT